MALYKGTITTAISGKIDGLVFSHNAGGKYIRNLAIPTNPNTPFQQTVRNAFSSLTASWANVLTLAQRNAWDLYGKNVPVINRVGDEIRLSGLSMYVRNNTARLSVGFTQIDDAPTIFTNSVFVFRPVLFATAATQTVDFPFVNTLPLAPWAFEVDSHLLFYLSRPQNLSINGFKGPYRFAGSIQGDPIPPSTPFSAGSPFFFVAGQKLFWRQQVVQVDGRISADARGVIVTEA